MSPLTWWRSFTKNTGAVLKTCGGYRIDLHLTFFLLQFWPSPPAFTAFSKISENKKLQNRPFLPVTWFCERARDLTESSSIGVQISSAIKLERNINFYFGENNILNKSYKTSENRPFTLEKSTASESTGIFHFDWVDVSWRAAGVVKSGD